MDLGTLINTRTAELGITFREAVRRARDAGHTISYGRLSQLTTGGISQVPYAPMLEAIAAAIDLPVDQVAYAALRSTGIPIPVHTHDEPSTLRMRCPDCVTQSSDADDLVIVLPHTGLSGEEFAELVREVQATIDREHQRYTHLEQENGRTAAG